MKPQEILTCPVCGGPFERWYSRRVERKYCSKVCRKRALYRIRNGIQIPVAEVAAKTVAKAAICLLEQKLMDGTPLHQATGKQCMGQGGWLTAVGKRVGASNVVGNKISEGELQKLWLAKFSA